nr:extensin family protein [Aurantimonas sp. VKM B-3413]
MTAALLAAALLLPAAGGGAHAESFLSRLLSGPERAHAESRHRHHPRRRRFARAAPDAQSLLPDEPPVPTSRPDRRGDATVDGETEGNERGADRTRSPTTGESENDRARSPEEGPERPEQEAATPVPPTPAPREAPGDAHDLEPRESEPRESQPKETRSGREPVARTDDAGEEPAARAAEDDEDLPQVGPVPEARPDRRDAAEGAPRPGTAASGAAAGATINTPAALRATEERVTPEGDVLAAAAVVDAKACEAVLASRGAEFSVGPSISEGACGVLRPVSISRLSSGIAIEPQTVILCRTALALDEWASGSILPAARAAFPNNPPKAMRLEGTYTCRARSSQDKISEHARGSAVDIGSIKLSDGTDIPVVGRDEDTPKARFQHAVRSGACGPFKTVLGPGTDADHASHFHLDIAARRSGGTYCK